MKRPLCWGLAALAAGMMCGRAGGVSFGPFVVAFLLVVALVCGWLFLQNRWLGAFALLPFAVAGVLVVQAAMLPPDAYLDGLAGTGQTVAVEGTVTQVTVSRSGRTWLEVAVSRVGGGHVPGKPVRISVLPKERVAVKEGQGVKLSGTLEAFLTQRNPGGYDAQQYNRARGVHYQMFAETVEAKEGLSFLGAMRAVSGQVKSRFQQVYKTALPPKEGAVLQSMIMGDKSGLDEETVELYRLAGIYHIISVSGLHMAIVALALQRLLNRVIHFRAAMVTTVVLLVLYCLLTGSSPSTVRALLMFGVAVAGPFLNRRPDPLSGVSFAAICLLLYRPFLLWDAGFQYSFAAVFGLLLGARPMQQALLRLGKKSGALGEVCILPGVAAGLAGSLAATLATTPVLAAYFRMVLPWSVLANACIVPTVGITVTIGFLVGIVGLFSLEAATFLSGVPFAFIKSYTAMGRLFVSLPGAVVYTGAPPAWVIVAYLCLYGLFLKLLLAQNTDDNPGKKLYKRLLVGACGLFVGGVVVSQALLQPLSVTMLDVGQGDCFVIQKKGACFVIDGGGNFGKDVGQNTGMTVLVPYLEYAGVQQVDGVFVTHPDTDHATGIIELLQTKKVKKLYVSQATAGDKALYDWLMAAAQANGTQVVALAAGDGVVMGDTVFSCLWPLPDAKTTDDNSTSLVLKLTHQNISFLFTGDMGAEEEAALLASGADVDAQVLKLGHHGSKYSSTPAFVEAVSPNVAMVSAGRNNPFGHPHPRVLGYFAEQGIPVYNTAAEGAAIFETDGKSLWLKQWRKWE